ncbi:MAG: hypothetical protein AAB439_03855 [Patescibacteria group bacterium]
MDKIKSRIKTTEIVGLSLLGAGFLSADYLENKHELTDNPLIDVGLRIISGLVPAVLGMVAARHIMK